MIKRKHVGLVLQLIPGERERERKTSQLFREKDKDALVTWFGLSQHRVTTSQRWFDDVWAGGRVVITICLCLTVVVEHLSPSNLVVADYWA